MPDFKIPEAFASSVVLAIKSAVAPILERLASAEARIAPLADVRDRVLTIEAKSAEPRSAESRSAEPDVADLVHKALAPLLERLAAAEARLSTLGDLRDRVVVVETKASATILPLPPEAGYDDLRDRIKALEGRPQPSGFELTDVREKFAELEKATIREWAKLCERVAVLEVRPAVPGPSGESGPAGKDGLDGKDGTAGLSFEGVYQEGQTYEKGNLVTWAGSSWHANTTTTTKPGDGSKDWTLMVKRGRDGKDGRDALTTPVVSVGAR